MPEEKKIYVSVILPLKLEWEPCYYLPPGMSADNVSAGTMVSVGFAGKIYVGPVSAVGIEPQVDKSRIKPVVSVVEGLPAVGKAEMDLWRFVADYYLCTVGEVYNAAYPSLKIGQEMALARQAALHAARVEKKMAVLEARKERFLSSACRSAELSGRARKDETRSKYKEAASRAESMAAAVAQEIEALKAEARAPGVGIREASVPETVSFSLSEAQKEAAEKIRSGFAEHKPVLLHGVTGSGKTEIYVTLALEALRRGRNVLYMVPEIAVSRQLEIRLGKVFGELLFAFHSKETAARRQQIASGVRNGRYVVLGTRSSLFLPHHDLGLVIVDEEHDTSYKQDAPAPRYNGRDTALMLARITGADVLLGTATPSLESLYNCKSGRMLKVDLDCRYFGSQDADVEIVDTVAERRKRGMSGDFSFKLINHVNDTLAAGGQVLILRGRRSYSPVVQCSSCGTIVKCPHCNVPLSWHRREGVLMCHYCGWREPYSGICPKCGAELVPLGAGTQKIEEEAAALFPKARIARLDSDTAMSAGHDAEVIRGFAEKKIDILVGTQVVTKGFDFDGLSLVAVIQADSLLGQQDFRADERAVQLLEQFRGRSGRRGSRGLLVVQTSQPEHPVYRALCSPSRQDGGGTSTGTDMDIIDSMMGERFSFGYPPFSRIVRVLLKDRSEAKVERLASELASAIRSAFGIGMAGFVQDAAAPVHVLGPYPPPVDRQSDMYMRNIRVSFRKDRALAANKRKLAEVAQRFSMEHAGAGHVALDVDPA